MEWLVIISYGSVLLLILLFSLGQLNLTFHYLKPSPARPEAQPLTDFPFVTIQLPLYNEKYVVGRLLDAVSQMDYPMDKFEIQVLDDSSDETTEIIKEKTQIIANSGVNIRHIRREKRTGYKAGALAHGLTLAKGDYIAIFDADFIPSPSFLIRTLPFFTSENIGMVQTKWAHLNKNYGWLTRVQAFWLDAHFTVEQMGRSKAGSFINFNGTAGIWRKACITDAGGWQHDTLTEDLDLSYRAQLKGWQFAYREEIESPAELPILMPAIKSQQYRWNKGAAETARKTLKQVLKSEIHYKHKVRAVFHLLNSSVFLLLFIASLLSIPMLFIKENHPGLGWVFDLGNVFMLGFFAIAFFYWVSARATHKQKTLLYFLTHFPAFLTFSMGMALHNSIAVIEGYLGIKSPFVRTPKFNIQNKSDSWQGNKYLHFSIDATTIFEGLLALYFAYGIYTGIKLEDYGLLHLHLMLAVGFGVICLLSLKPMQHEG